MADQPVRLVVHDDLGRSRLTVLLRIILVIPHLIALLLFTVVAFFVAFAGWFAALALGRLPQGIHRLLAEYVRYATQVDAYIGLVANPYPPMPFSGASHAVELEIAPVAPQRRWTVALRLLLTVPALVISAVIGSWVWSMGGGGPATDTGDYGGWYWSDYTGGVATAAVILAWFASLVLGRTPRGLRDFAAYAIGYGAQTWSYLLLLTDRYPDARPDSHVPPLPPEPHPVRLALGGELRRSRLTVFFRLLLALPHLVWLTLWSIAAVLLSIVAWLVTLVLGRNPMLFQRFLGAFVRYQAHVTAYLLLVGGPFPGFDGRPGVYPVDVTVDHSERQHRLKTLFRLLLALPALVLAAAYTGAAWVAAFFGWFASLVLGRMPAGLAQFGAAALRYDAQTTAYLFFLTDRYPFASPALAVEEPEPEPEQLAVFEPGPPEPVH